MKLKGKVAAITGGNSGIGKAIAERFVHEGAKVSILGRDKKKLDEVSSALSENCLSIQGDVSKLSDLETFFKKTHDHFGNLDILVVNAGVTAKAPTESITEEIYDKVMDINVKGAYFTVQKAIPYLNKDASITGISSVSSLLGIKHHGIYAASKAALNKMFIAFSAEFLESKGWRFNLISPGYTKTPIFNQRAQNNPHYFDEVNNICPLKRFADPKEIASAVLYFASDEAKYICGANLVVDGGISSIFPYDELYKFKNSSLNAPSTTS